MIITRSLKSKVKMIVQISYTKYKVNISGCSFIQIDSVICSMDKVFSLASIMIIIHWRGHYDEVVYIIPERFISFYLPENFRSLLYFINIRTYY